MASDQTPPDDENKMPPKRTRAYLRKARQKARRIGLEAIDGEHAARLLEELGVDVLNDDVSLINAGTAGGQYRFAAGRHRYDQSGLG